MSKRDGDIDGQIASIISNHLIKSKQQILEEEAVNIYSTHPSLPLDDSKRKVRLLSLHHSHDPDALLVGELHIATLDDEYTALSYVWGNFQVRFPIRLNGFDTTITSNLAIALRRLRMEKKATNIWIDALCINQTDNAEKSHEVQRMDIIYKHAALQTILWLGEEENQSGEAMRVIATADQTFFDEYDPTLPSPVWQAIALLLKRPWWKRMWVIQETMLSPNPIVKCGAEEVSFEKFVVFRNLHWDAQNTDLERFKSLRHIWRECPFGPLMWLNWRDWVGGTLSSWLLDVAPFESFLLRDKVYALLGLVEQSSREKITVAYDASVHSDRMVLLEATRVCFLEVGLLPLQQGQIDKDTSLDLPTWCPDWKSRAVAVPFVGFGFTPWPATCTFVPPVEKWLFGKDRDPKPSFNFSKEREILFVHGFHMDTVDFVDGVGTEGNPEVPAYFGDDVQLAAKYRSKRQEMTKEACLRWEQQVNDLKETSHDDENGGREEAFCRTIAANRDFGKKELRSDMKPIFDAWQDRRKSSESTALLEPGQLEGVQDFNNAVISRCTKRTFITTTLGRFGLAPQGTKVGDLVCIVYGAEIPYIFRKPPPELGDVPGTFVGETYLHGIMQGEYLETARGEDFTAFWLK